MMYRTSNPTLSDPSDLHPALAYRGFARGGLRYQIVEGARAILSRSRSKPKPRPTPSTVDFKLATKVSGVIRNQTSREVLVCSANCEIATGRARFFFFY